VDEWPAQRLKMTKKVATGRVCRPIQRGDLKIIQINLRTKWITHFLSSKELFHP
jgi:hypothetical protein